MEFILNCWCRDGSHWNHSVIWWFINSTQFLFLDPKPFRYIELWVFFFSFFFFFRCLSQTWRMQWNEHNGNEKKKRKKWSKIEHFERSRWHSRLSLSSSPFNTFNSNSFNLTRIIIKSYRLSRVIRAKNNN